MFMESNHREREKEESEKLKSLPIPLKSSLLNSSLRASPNSITPLCPSDRRTQGGQTNVRKGEPSSSAPCGIYIKAQMLICHQRNWNWNWRNIWISELDLRMSFLKYLSETPWKTLRLEDSFFFFKCGVHSAVLLRSPFELSSAS